MNLSGTVSSADLGGSINGSLRYAARDTLANSDKRHAVEAVMADRKETALDSELRAERTKFETLNASVNIPPAAKKEIERLLSFKSDTITSIKNSDIVCLCTDDSVFFKKFDDESNLAKTHCCFSYRLGFNTVAQDIHKNTFQPQLSRYIDNGDTISWNWSEHNPFNNYGYPFGLDGHLYDSSKLLSIIEYLDFSSTNQLETQLFYQKHRISERISSY